VELEIAIAVLSHAQRLHCTAESCLPIHQAPYGSPPMQLHIDLSQPMLPADLCELCRALENLVVYLIASLDES
jgi:hypothetical protein